MTVAHSPIPTGSQPPPSDDVEVAHRAEFASQQLSPSVVLVRVTGEIDACNALELVAYVGRHTEESGELILDLSDLDFFGTQGFSALHNINVNCSRYAVNWVVVPSADAYRLLAVCDPAEGLPVAESVEQAGAALKRGPRSHLIAVPPAV